MQQSKGEGQGDKQFFYQQEIKKRDNIVLFLCQKV